ncbi:unnamed protein product, partial [Adineta ricciae]
MSFHHLHHHHHLAENSWQDRSNNYGSASTNANRANIQVSTSSIPISSTSNTVDFQPPYFPPPFPTVSHHQHPFEQIQSNHAHNLDYVSSSSSPPFTGNQTAQSYNSLMRSSAIDETAAPLSNPYGAYAEYAASYYTRHAMVLDPESLQLY